MQPSRRTLFRAVLAILAAGSLGALGWKGRQIRMRIAPITDTEREIVRRFVDLIIPRDDTPGGLDLAVDRALLDEADRDPSFARQLAEGCQWLDQEASKESGKAFVALPEAEQNGLLSTMSSARSFPGRLFWSLRDRIHVAYYTDPRSWAPLGLAGPPQYDGFPDYAEAPKRVS